jgi:hypothetical protein
MKWPEPTLLVQFQDTGSVLNMQLILHKHLMVSFSLTIVETIFVKGGPNKVNKQLVLSMFVVLCVGKNTVLLVTIEAT